MARPPKVSSSILTRTSLSFFHASRFLPVAEKEKDMNLGSMAPTLSCDVTDLDDPLGLSCFLSDLGSFSGLSFWPDARLKKAPNLEGLALAAGGAGVDGFGGGGGGGSPTCFSSSGTTSGRSQSRLKGRNSGMGTSSIAGSGEFHLGGGDMEELEGVDCADSGRPSVRPSTKRGGRVLLPGEGTGVGAGEGTAKCVTDWARLVKDRLATSSEKQADGICRVLVTTWRHCGQKAFSKVQTPCDSSVRRPAQARKTPHLGDLVFSRHQVGGGDEMERRTVYHKVDVRLHRNLFLCLPGTHPDAVHGADPSPATRCGGERQRARVSGTRPTGGGVDGMDAVQRQALMPGLPDACATSSSSGERTTLVSPSPSDDSR